MHKIVYQKNLTGRTVGRGMKSDFKLFQSASNLHQTWMRTVIGK